MTDLSQTANDLLIEVLDEIEQNESQLLAWGLVDGRINHDELRKLIDPLLDRAMERGMTDFLNATGVITALQARALLFETDDLPYSGFRSRMAETIRLLFRLRQLFPKHAGPDRWLQAATLVSDFRFLWRRRRYPRRDVEAATALATIDEAAGSRQTREAISALLDRGNPNFRLAGFQIRAVQRIADALNGRKQSGTLVSAGTGSGKTLAFYIPALARVATHLVQDPTAWVKALAIYPRIELLRDQFAEIYVESRRLDALLATSNRRPIRIGCLFGGTPRSAAHLDQERLPDGWRRIDGGTICGYMRCPRAECSGDLIWLDTDRRVRRERLVCNACGTVVAGEEIALTRDSMRRIPPDIMFSTTEMLNQRMADSNLRHLFGLPPQAVRPVELVLLDEVHYYSGTNGAQVAYLLRRWQHLLRSPVCFVGLSATVRDGTSFFARMIGLPEHKVAEIAPLPDEMTEEGAEYLIALRGDPVSRTSLLSTTIQTTMLLARALDHGANRISGGLFGLRSFAFTDNLDVINRLYFSLLDAEGRNHRGDPDPTRHPAGPLAVLRRPIESAARERYGQNWRMSEAIGHRLDERKRVGRTSSQDPGVSAHVDVIVATASLEVGFNDPTVGAIIQHKAPRGAAQFLQRKGRAGRSRRMRPWTAVVLSDYGRDRLAYQAYDQLFDPQLPAQSLPLSSRHIRRIQAVYALIDYLGRDGPDGRPRGNIWSDLSGPANSASANSAARREFLVRRLVLILEREAETEALSDHIGRALQLPTEEVGPLLWEHPRPLLTAVIPTALRRLSTNWRRGEDQQVDYHVFNSPLPDFAPGQLFGDLNTPEVAVIIAPSASNGNPDAHSMPIAPAMREYAPGRVSRRFATRHGSVRHWVGPNTVPSAGTDDIDLSAFYDMVLLGQWQQRREDQIVHLPVYRPYEVRPVQPPRDIRDTSNAQLLWSTQIVARTRGLLQQSPSRTPWGDLIAGIEAFLHGEQNPVEYRRFAHSSQADIQIERQDGVRVRFGFRHGRNEAALGFANSCDALRFQIRLPHDIWRRSTASSTPMWKALRTARYFDDALTGKAIAIVDNPFARRWLAEIYLAAITFDAISRNVTLAEADGSLSAGVATLPITDVLQAIFQSAPDDDQVANNLGVQATDKLRQDLERLIRRPDVRAALHDHGRLLWEPVEPSWEPWLHQRFKSTVGAAALEAIRNLCPDIGEEGLLVDIDPGPRSHEDVLPEEEVDAEIWISESSPGGIGLIETFLGAYAEDPRRFYQLMAAALRSNEHEIVDHQISQLLTKLAERSSPDLNDAVSAYRGRQSQDMATEAMARLRLHLRRHGFALFHGYVSALANRILRPGTTESSDAFLLQAIELWDAAELRLGIEIDATAVAYALGRDDAIDRVMAAAGLTPPTDNLSAWRHNIIYGLLWPRGALMRRGNLGVYNPFAKLPEPERLLVADLLSEGATCVFLENADWDVATLAHLSEHGMVTLVCPYARAALLSDALNFLATNPVPSDYLSVFSRLVNLRRVGETYQADVELAEFG